MAKPSVMKILVKLDRIAAWTLLVTALLFFVSGYGMLKYLMDVELGKFIHDKILPIPFLTAFIVHSSFAVHLALKRWKLWNSKTLYILLAVALAVFGTFVLIDRGVIKGKPPVQNIDLD